MVLTKSSARQPPNLSRAGGRRTVHVGGAQQLPPQMIDIKRENRLRISPLELPGNPFFPPLGEIRLRIHILCEETVLMGYSQEIEHRRDHIDVRYQNRLGEILREILVRLADARPQPGNG